LTLLTNQAVTGDFAFAAGHRPAAINLFAGTLNSAAAFMALPKPIAGAPFGLPRLFSGYCVNAPHDVANLLSADFLYLRQNPGLPRRNASEGITLDTQPKKAPSWDAFASLRSRCTGSTTRPCGGGALPANRHQSRPQAQEGRRRRWDRVRLDTGLAPQSVRRSVPVSALATPLRRARRIWPHRLEFEQCFSCN
jgi:hypothetical protein